jgi:ribosome-associated protein
MNDVRVNRSLVIPAAELSHRFTTSGGPGGQHANKASTRVELLWDIEASTVLGPRQRARIHGRLKNRLDSEGRLRVVADTHRSQMRNREEAEHRLASLVADALRPRRTRVPTQPSRAATQRRIETKKRRGELKRLRGERLD